MNILYISYDGLTDPLGQSQILPYLTGLSKLGYNFTIVSLEKPSLLNEKRATILNTINHLPIKWEPVPYDVNGGIKAKRKNNARLTKAVFALHQQNPAQLVHSRSYPASLIALKLKKQFGIPFIFDMRGFWADERVDGKIWNLKKPLHRIIYNYFKRKEQVLLKKSNHIVSLTQAAKHHIVSTLCTGIEPTKITVIPCCADLNLFEPKGKNIALLDSLNIHSTQKIMLYSGSVGTWYMLDEMIDFFKQFQLKIPDAVFLLLTHDHELVHKTMQQKGINKNAYRVTGVNRANMPDYISLADIALYFIKPAFSKIASSPVKLGEYMACGCPVICNNGVGDIDEHAQLTNQIVMTYAFNNDAYNKSIEIVLTQKPNPGAAIEFAQKLYSLENGIDLYAKIYNDLIQELN